MSINFFEERCQSKTNSPNFGICDNPDEPQKPAYINEDNKVNFGNLTPIFKTITY